jgi:hypothetical protein
VLFIVFIASHQPIIIFLPVDPYIDELIVSCCFFVAMTGAMLSYFGNKMYLLAIGADLNAQFKLVYKNCQKGEESVDEAEVLRRASEFDINSSLKVPDHEKASFYNNEIPSDVTSEYCVRRAALWQQFRHELEAHLLTDAYVRSPSNNNIKDMAHVALAFAGISKKKSKDGLATAVGSPRPRAAAVEELRVSLGGKSSRAESLANSQKNSADDLNGMDFGNNGRDNGRGDSGVNTRDKSSSGNPGIDGRVSSGVGGERDDMSSGKVGKSGRVDSRDKSSSTDVGRVICRVDGKDQNSSAEAARRGVNDSSNNGLSTFDGGSRNDSSAELVVKGVGDTRDGGSKTSKVAIGDV